MNDSDAPEEIKGFGVVVVFEPASITEGDAAGELEGRGLGTTEGLGAAVGPAALVVLTPLGVTCAFAEGRGLGINTLSMR